MLKNKTSIAKQCQRNSFSMPRVLSRYVNTWSKQLHHKLSQQVSIFVGPWRLVNYILHSRNQSDNCRINVITIVQIHYTQSTSNKTTVLCEMIDVIVCIYIYMYMEAFNLNPTVSCVSLSHNSPKAHLVSGITFAVTTPKSRSWNCKATGVLCSTNVDSVYTWESMTRLGRMCISASKLG